MKRRIAVLTASIDREYQRGFASDLAAAGAKRGVDVCFFNTQGHSNYDVFTSYAQESEIFALPSPEQFDGVISMLATMGNESVADRLRETLARFEGKPHVSIDVPMEGAVSILFDDAVSVRAVTEHMILKHGARRFAYVSGPLDSNVAMTRQNAFRETLGRHGIELRDEMVFSGNWTRFGGRRAAQSLLSRDEPLPDAVLCGNDDMAISLIEYFSEHGVRIPEDIRVIGFDALKEAVSLGITTIIRPIGRAALEAMDILCSWMDGQEPKERERILPTVPVYGNSCGCVQSAELVSRRLWSLASARERVETILSRASMSFSNLSCVGDEEELRSAMRELTAVWGIRELYLCVDPELCRGEDTSLCRSEDSTGYPEHMLLLYGLRQAEEVPMEVFSLSNLIPGHQEQVRGASALVFCPLYYRSRSLGYVAMEPGNGTGPALYSILMLLNGALMGLYLQNSIRRNAVMAELTIHDIMTGMLNRRGYVEQAPAVFDRARREKKLFAVISADMDHMKDINDAYGHLAGDEAIRRVGKCLMILEEAHMTPVHISGDEFLAYGTVGTLQDARGMLTRIRRELERSNREDPWVCKLSVSLGLYAGIPESGEEIDDFLLRADRAMYSDKDRKRHPTAAPLR